jgi:cytochrome b
VIPDQTRPALVWDWPTRVFHWLLVLSIIVLFVTGKVGGNWMEWHERTGLFVLGLILFRLIWGLVGGYHARFVNFVRGPKAILGYLRGEVDGGAGHNPLGALSVLALLTVVAFQAITGLFANDDILLEGPWAKLVSKDTSDFLTKLHHWSSDALLVLVGLHLAAIAYYWWVRKENLVLPMITGNKQRESAPTIARPPWLAPLLIGILVALLWWVFKK